MKPYRKCLVIGHTDGHGAVATAISKKNLEAECEEVEVLARFPDTGVVPKFWSETIDRVDPGKYDKIVIVDIPIDARNPRQSVEKLSAMCRRTRTVFIDHHPTLTPEVVEELERTGCEVVKGEGAYDTVYGPPHPKWSLVGAISDRSREAIGMLRERPSEKDRLMALADGLDVAVRKDLLAAIDAVLRDDESFFLEMAREVPDPADVDVVGEVAIVRDAVPEGWIFKVLDRACRKHGTPYGAYLQENVPDRATGEPVDQVFLIRYWMAEGEPPARQFIPEELRDKAIGHPDAQRLVLPPGDGKRVLELLAKAINRRSRQS